MAVDLSRWVATYFSKGITKMVQIRYWLSRALLLGTLVTASAVAAGWKWDRFTL
jgi:hypothetical protein